MPMKILLIAPSVSLCSKERRRLAPRHPPYILASTASLFMRRGFQVKIYDAFMERASIEDIRKEAEEYSPQLIGLAGAELDRDIFIEMISATKRVLGDKLSDVPVVLIGINNPHVLFDIMQKTDIHYSVLGDPEECMLEIAEHIDRERGGNFTDIPGLAVNRGGKIVLNGEKRLNMDLDSLPFPAWQLLDIDKYPSSPHRYYLSHSPYLLMASRGCSWNRCLFCERVSVLNDSRYRVRSPKSVVSEIEFAVKNYGTKEIRFEDSNFNTNIKWLTEFRDTLGEQKIDIRWSCLVRLDRVTPESLKLMRQAGCWSIVFGIESSCQHLLDIIEKGYSVNQTGKAIECCRQVGIETVGSFLVGLPGERPEDVMKSVKFARTIGLDYAQFFIAKWPTRPAEFANYGKFEETKDYSLFNHQGYAFIPNAYKDLNHLKTIWRKAYISFYLSPAVVFRHLKKISSLVSIKRAVRALFLLAKIGIER